MASDGSGQTGDTSWELEQSTELGEPNKQRRANGELGGHSADSFNRQTIDFRAESATDTPVTVTDGLSASRSTFSLTAIRDIRPTPLDLFTPSKGSADVAGAAKSDNEDVDSTADIPGDQSGFTLTPSASQDSFEVIEETDQSFQGNDGDSDDLSFTNMPMDVYDQKRLSDNGASTNQTRNAYTVESAEHFTRSGQQTAWNDDELDLEGHERHERPSWVQASYLAEMNHILANGGQAHSQSGVADQFAFLKRGYDDTADRSWAEIDRALQMLSEVRGGLGSTDVSDDGSSVSRSLGRLSTYDLDAESYHRNEMYNKQEPTVEHSPYEDQDEFLTGPEAYAISSRAHAAELVAVAMTSTSNTTPSPKKLSTTARATTTWTSTKSCPTMASQQSHIDPRTATISHTESPNRLDACSVESAEALHRGQQWRGYDENTLNRQPSCVDFAMSPVPTDRTSEYAGQDLFFQRVPSFTWSAATMPKQLAPESTGLHSVYRGSASASTESMEWPENKQTEFSEGASYGQPLFFRHGCMSASSSSHLEPDHGVNSAFADQSSGHSFEALEEQQRRDACRPLDDGNRRPPSHLDFAATPDEREYGAVSRSVSVQSLPRSMESAEQLQRDAMMHLDDVYSATAMQKYEEPSGSDAPDGGSYESQRLSGSESSHGESDAGDDRHLTTLESAEHFQRSLPCQERAEDGSQASLPADDHNRYSLESAENFHRNDNFRQSECHRIERQPSYDATEIVRQGQGSRPGYSLESAENLQLGHMFDGESHYLTKQPSHVDSGLSFQSGSGPSKLRNMEMDEGYRALREEANQLDASNNVEHPAAARYDETEDVRISTPRYDYYDESGLVEFGLSSGRPLHSPAPSFRRDRMLEEQTSFASPTVIDREKLERDSFDLFMKMSSLEEHEDKGDATAEEQPSDRESSQSSQDLHADDNGQTADLMAGGQLFRKEQEDSPSVGETNAYRSYTNIGEGITDFSHESEHQNTGNLTHQDNHDSADRTRAANEREARWQSLKANLPSQFTQKDSWHGHSREDQESESFSPTAQPEIYRQPAVDSMEVPRTKPDSEVRDVGVNLREKLSDNVSRLNGSDDFGQNTSPQLIADSGDNSASWDEEGDAEYTEAEVSRAESPGLYENEQPFGMHYEQKMDDRELASNDQENFTTTDKAATNTGHDNQMAINSSKKEEESFVESRESQRIRPPGTLESAECFERDWMYNKDLLLAIESQNSLRNPAEDPQRFATEEQDSERPEVAPRRRASPPHSRTLESSECLQRNRMYSDNNSHESLENAQESSHDMVETRNSSPAYDGMEEYASLMSRTLESAECIQRNEIYSEKINNITEKENFDPRAAQFSQNGDSIRPTLESAECIQRDSVYPKSLVEMESHDDLKEVLEDANNNLENDGEGSSFAEDSESAVDIEHAVQYFSPLARMTVEERRHFVPDELMLRQIESGMLLGEIPREKDAYRLWIDAQMEPSNDMADAGRSVESAEALHRIEAYDREMSLRDNWNLADHIQDSQEISLLVNVADRQSEPGVLSSALSKIFSEQKRLDAVGGMGEGNAREEPLFEQCGDYSLTSGSGASAEKRRQPLKEADRLSYHQLDVGTPQTPSETREMQQQNVAPKESTAGLYSMYNPLQDFERTQSYVVNPSGSEMIAATSLSLESSGFDMATIAGQQSAGVRQPVKPPRAKPIPATAESTPDGALDTHLMSVSAPPIVSRPEHHAAEASGCYRPGTWTYNEEVVKPFRQVVDVVWEENGDSALPTAVLLYPCLFPFTNHPDYGQIMQNLHHYIMNALQGLGDAYYRLIVFNSAVTSDGEPCVTLLTQLYRAMDGKMKEKLMQILIVHPNLKVKAELKTVGRAVLSKQFFGKIGFVRSLSDLSRVQSVQFADVPMPVRNYDRRHQRNVMTNTCC